MNLLIIYGGKSCEHDISLITACLAKGYFGGKVHSAYLDKDNRCFLVPNDFTPSQHLKGKFKNQITFCFGEGKIAICRGKRIKNRVSIDVAVNCCHGVNGEEGAVSALCQLANIPLVGADLIPSAIAMDKVACKWTLKSLGIPVLAGKQVLKDDFEGGDCDLGKITYPVIVKPSVLGSSIGISVAHSMVELQTALKRAFAYDNQVLCERALVDFYEVNCSAMTVEGKVVTSEVDTPVASGDLLTFQDKYERDGKWQIPSAEVDAKVAERVKRLTEKIYQKLRFSGVIRVDFIIDRVSNKVYANEINTIPGSLAYGLWSKLYTTRQFGQILLQEAIAHHKSKSSIIHSYSSSVLDKAICKK